MTDIRLTVQGLAVDYPTARVVDNVSFTLGNERLALVGESGSGKSMTARALMGLVRKPGVVSAERLEVLGRDVLTLSARGWRALRGNDIAMMRGCFVGWRFAYPTYRIHSQAHTP